MDPQPGRGGVEWIADQIRELRNQIKDLQTPSGTQLYNTTSRLIAEGITPVPLFTVDNAPAISATLGTEFARAAVPVPDDFTRALVSITASARLRNDGGAGSWALMTLNARIQGASKVTVFSSIDGQKFGLASAAATDVLDELTPGSYVTVGAQVAIPATYTLPQVSVSGFILFLR